MRANFVMSGVADGLRRNLLMSIALVLTTAVSLSFVAAAILTGVEINRFRDHYRGLLNVSIYLCPGVTQATKTANACPAAISDAERTALAQRMNADSQITSITFVSQHDAYELGLKTLDPSEAQFLQPGDLPASYTVKLKDIDRDYGTVSARYADAPGVLQIQNENDTLKTILSLFRSGLLAAVIVALIVLISAIILIAITIQVAAVQRRTETNIMRLVGASRWMTQLPFVLEAVIAAAIGGLAATVAAWIGKWYLLDHVFRSEVRNRVVPNLALNDVLIASGISLIVGVVLAAITAYGTLRLYVRL